MATPVPLELIEAARGGGTADIERLVETIWPDAYRLARAIIGESQAAEDAAQEACINIYRTIGSLRSAAAFRAWFYRLVVREAAELKRRRSKPEPGIEPKISDENACIDIWRALSMLPQKLREVVVLRYFEDLSSREIGSALQIPAGTVRFRLMMAKQRLRPLLAEDSENHMPIVQEVKTNAL